MDEFIKYINEFNNNYNNQKWCESFHSFINDNNAMLENALKNNPNLPVSMERLEEILDVIDNNLSNEYRIAHGMPIHFVLSEMSYDEMEKYKESVISYIESHDLSEDEKKNIDLLKFCLANGLMKMILYFDESLFTMDILNKYKDIFSNYLKERAEYSTYSITIFKFLLDNKILNKNDLLKFNTSFYKKELFNAYKDQFIKALEIVNLSEKLKTKDLFEFALENNLTNVINKLTETSVFTKEILEKYKDNACDYLKGITNKEVINNICKKDEIIEFCLENNIDNINNFYFANNIREINSDFLIKNKEYVKDYFKRIEIPRVFKQNKEVLKFLINENIINIEMDKELAISKIDYLYKINDEVLDTINLKILKYDFDLAFLSKISLHIDLQERIIKLNKQSLNVFYRVSRLLSDNSMDLSGIVIKYLDNISKYESILHNVDINTLSDDEIKNYLEIVELDCDYGINDCQDLKSDRFIEKKNRYFIKFELNIEKQSTIEIMEAILQKQYAIDLKTAKFILERYSCDYNDLIKSGLDQRIIKIIYGLDTILHCDSKEKLIELYQNIDIIKNDFINSTNLESIIRKSYAEMYNKTLYKVDNQQLLQNVSYNGEKIDVYEASEDFSMQVHAISAFFGYTRPSNFKSDWDRPKVTFHGISTSYITNSQIATVSSVHPILGFSEYEGSSLLLAGNYDLASNVYNVRFDVSSYSPHKILPPELMINATRCGYNEMVIERRKNDANSNTIKRQPNYIVYIVDTMENKDNFNSENEAYQETLQAAHDFNVPIVIIDRSKHSKREMMKCENLETSFRETHNLETLSKLFLTYFNNNIGSKFFTTNPMYENNNLFTDNAVAIFYNRITDFIINEIENEQEKAVILMQIKKLLEKELINYNVEHHSEKHNKPPFDFKDAINQIQEMVLKLNDVPEESIVVGRSR